MCVDAAAAGGDRDAATAAAMGAGECRGWARAAPRRRMWGLALASECDERAAQWMRDSRSYTAPRLDAGHCHRGGDVVLRG